MRSYELRALQKGREAYSELEGGRLARLSVRRENSKRLRRVLADGSPANDAKFWVSGSRLEVPAARWLRNTPAKAARGDRRAISEFSHRSASALLRRVMSLRDAERPLLLTVTYPSVWPSDPNVWKRHLDTFAKRLRRTFKKVCAIWKLEPQKRGAPHFHFLVYGVPFVPYQWLGRTWFEIVGSGDAKHRKAGTRVERAYSHRAAKVYASKRYMGKSVELPVAWVKCGRLWGVIARENEPRSAVVTVPLSHRGAIAYRRLIWRWMKAKSRNPKLPAGKAAIYTSCQHVFMALAVQCAKDHPLQRHRPLPLLVSEEISTQLFWRSFSVAH